MKIFTPMLNEIFIFTYLKLLDCHNIAMISHNKDIFLMNNIFKILFTR
jgi:hypothetical protein